jgi:hypothetical protein
MTVDPPPNLHVVSLEYALQPDERFTYENPPSVKFETKEARFHLADGILKCEMKEHFADAGAAQKVVDPILRAWEVDADLRHNRGELRFKYKTAEVIDLSPAPPGSVKVTVVGNAVLTVTGTLSTHVTRGTYPEPPPDHFRLNPDAESILRRYEGYLDGREPLPAMAYFCLTVLEGKAGGRGKATAMYRIHKDVLRKIGDLSTNRGDLLNARKANATQQPLSGAESAWLEEAMKTLVRRLGDTRNPVSLPEIPMKDLPKL